MVEGKGGRFEGKVVVVTGASAGIGLATAEQLGAEGACIVAVGRRKDVLEEAARKITAAGAKKVLTVSADVSTSEGNKAMIDAAMGEFGEIHGLFANAGTYKPGLFSDVEENAVDELLNLNIKSVIYGIKYAMAAMKEKGTKGAILVNSSAMSHVAKSWAQGGGLYSATKAAADMLVQYAAIEGIRVNAIRPGVVATPLHGADKDPEAVEAFASDKQLVGRAGRSEEVAKFAAFLLSDDATFITGSLHDIDGGFAVTAGGGGTATNRESNLLPP